MTRERKCAILWSAPFALWLGMLMALPATPACYAARTVAVALVGAVCFALSKPERALSADADRRLGPAAAAFIGLAVAFLWIWPERFDFYLRWLTLQSAADPAPSPYATAPAWLVAVRLVGSAFVIAPAEELFFRSFLYRRLQSPHWLAVPHRRFDPSAFAWTVALFALEHDRPLVAALAGAAYGFAYLRGGIWCAVGAHALTNLALGAWVVSQGAWRFW